LNDTPRTDAAVKAVDDDAECLPGCDSYGHEDMCPMVNGHNVIAELARQLERDLGKATQLLLSLRREGLEKGYPTESGRDVDDFLHDRIFDAK
jgi:hypothetical protein